MLPYVIGFIVLGRGILYRQPKECLRHVSGATIVHLLAITLLLEASTRLCRYALLHESSSAIGERGSNWINA